MVSGLIIGENFYQTNLGKFQVYGLVQDIWNEAVYLPTGNAGLYIPFQRYEVEEDLQIQIFPGTTKVTGYGQNNKVIGMQHRVVSSPLQILLF